MVGKTLNVFNMNQHADSADLFGAFKPVDLKYLLKPIDEQFLAVFLALFQKHRTIKIPRLNSEMLREKHSQRVLPVHAARTVQQ